MPKRVLAVGHCGFDCRALSGLLSKAFGAETVAADSAAEALREARGGGYDLILVNRVFDAGGGLGLDLIEQLQRDDATKAIPVMLITNYADQQAAAVAAGARAGFGKSALHEPGTRDLLAPYLQ